MGKEILFSRREFCKAAGISERTEARMRARGELSFLRLGKRRIIYLERHLREFFEGCEVRRKAA